MSISKIRHLYKKKHFKEGISKCAYCCVILTRDTCHVDHIISLKDGGKSNKDNLTLACSRCNFFKGSLSVAKFLEKVKKEIANFPNTLDYYESIVNTLSNHEKNTKAKCFPRTFYVNDFLGRRVGLNKKITS